MISQKGMGKYRGQVGGLDEKWEIFGEVEQCYKFLGVWRVYWIVFYGFFFLFGIRLFNSFRFLIFIFYKLCIDDDEQCMQGEELILLRLIFIW